MTGERDHRLVPGAESGSGFDGRQRIAALVLAAGSSRRLGQPKQPLRDSERLGRDHPFWFHRSLFDALTELHGDKAAWKLLESGRWPTVEANVDAHVPLDVDTWADYEQLVAGRP